jgi:DNA primase
MPGVDFIAIRLAVSMEQVLDLLGYAPSSREGEQPLGPCPVHGSKSAESRSFSGNLKRNALRCFSCGARGNQLDLWSRTQSLSLYEAALDLCRRWQIEVPSAKDSVACREEEPVWPDMPRHRKPN